MRWVLNKNLVCSVLFAFVCYVLPVNAFAKGTLKTGKASADEAAALQFEKPDAPAADRSLRFAVPATGGYAAPDTTEFEFPGEAKTHLARDITVFLIASAFVAYFLIKVFLEGDKDEQQPDDGGNGKPPPPV
jgi:hypothetical protein